MKNTNKNVNINLLFACLLFAAPISAWAKDTGYLLDKCKAYTVDLNTGDVLLVGQISSFGCSVGSVYQRAITQTNTADMTIVQIANDFGLMLIPVDTAEATTWNVGGVGTEPYSELHESQVSVSGEGLTEINGVLYLSSYYDDNLYLIDKNTALLTLVGSMSGVGINAIAWHKDDGVLYGLSSTTEKLYSLNIATGAATEVITLDRNVELGAGLSVDSVGNLWANDTDEIYTINKQTGATVAVPLSSTLGGVAAFTIFSSIPTSIAHDLDADSDGDLVFYDDISGDLSYWLLQDAALDTSTWVASVPSAHVVAIQDVDSDLDSDMLWQNMSNSVVTVWEMEGGVRTNVYDLGYQIGYDVVASGDMDGDGDKDLILIDSANNISLWFLEGGLKQSQAWLGNWNQTVAAVGDTDNDGDNDLIIQDAAGNVSAIEMQSGAKVATHWLGVWAGRSVVGAGDADNDGDADIFMENAGDVMVIEMQGGVKVTSHWLGTWSGTEVKAIGDIDKDGDVDLIQQNTGTGSVQVVEIQNANKVTGRWLAIVAYDVKGVIDADGDGDVDVAMQDGSGNVALIELEAGSKVGGAKWLGINAGEMKLFP